MAIDLLPQSMTKGINGYVALNRVCRQKSVLSPEPSARLEVGLFSRFCLAHGPSPSQKRGHEMITLEPRHGALIVIAQSRRGNDHLPSPSIAGFRDSKWKKHETTLRGMGVCGSVEHGRHPVPCCAGLLDYSHRSAGSRSNRRF
jgi:hypothetical protein